MATIDHSDILDLRDLAELATECGEEIEDTDTEEVDREESTETLEKLAELCGDLGRMVDATDAEAVAAALEALGNETTGPLVAEDHFVAYCKDLVSELGYLPEELPAFIENNIDWDGVAEDLQVDYTSITFDGEDYYIR